jgi:WD40 repeat protein
MWCVRTDVHDDKASAFLLSILSPVWRAKLCGEVGSKARWQLALEAGEAGLFGKLVTLGSGAPVMMEGGLEEVMALGLMADRYQVDAVQGAVEEAVVRLLTVENCGIVLARSSGSGLVRVERASRELALREFDEFARTAGFMGLGEEVLGSLLEDDGLCTEREELVYEGVARWMKEGEGRDVRGSGLLGKVRFPLMKELYLAALSQKVSGELAGLAELVEEALGLQIMMRDKRGRQQLRHLDARSMEPRGGVRWEQYVGGGERLLAAGESVYSVAADDLFVCGGLKNGSIRVWSRSTLEIVRTLTGHRGPPWALLFVGGRLVSGSEDESIRVWDVATGRCKGVLEGKAGKVKSLALCGGRLLSRSVSGTVRVWGMYGEAWRWRCERALDGHESKICCMVAWGDMVACGCEDGGICIWSSERWALERTVRGPDSRPLCMVVSGRRLISSFRDGTVRAWSTETWCLARMVWVYPKGSEYHIRRLAVCGSTLVGSSASVSMAPEREVLVWDLKTLQPLHRFVLAAGVWSLACDGREAWGAVGREVVVWGRRG